VGTKKAKSHDKHAAKLHKEAKVAV
jgi:hypothetical protein